MYKKGIYLILLLVSITGNSTTLNCPNVLPTDNANTWIINKPLAQANNPNQKYYFNNADILLGKPGDEKQKAPAWLAPDKTIEQQNKLIQHWKLDPTQGNFVLICRYDNTATYLSQIIAAPISTCVKTLALNPKQPADIKIISMKCGIP